MKKDKSTTSKKINVKITWSSKEVNVSDVLPTPNNYKIKTELGKQLLQTSLNRFGLAGTAVVNPQLVKGKPTGKYILIDGNSRREEAIENQKKKMWVSVPDKPLGKDDFEEMAAMFDYAVAGNVDLDRIKKDKGNTSDFYNRWGMEVPMALLEKMGNNTDVSKLQYPGSKGKKAEEAAPTERDIKMVNLFFSTKEEEEFRKIEEKLAKRFKTNDTTSTVFKALKSIK
jgi:hypothetical protein